MIKEIETHTRSDRCCCHESLMAQNIHPMLTQCWSTVRDAMLAYRLLNQNKVNSCLHICLLFVGPVSYPVAQLLKKTFCQNENGSNRKVCFENDGWELVIGLLPPFHKWYNNPHPPPFRRVRFYPHHIVLCVWVCVCACVCVFIEDTKPNFSSWDSSDFNWA